MSATPSPLPAPGPTGPKQSTAVWWILGVIGAALVVSVLAGLVLATYFARRVRVNESGQKVEISTPVGKIEVNKSAKHGTALPVYPSATASDSRGGNMAFSTAEGEGVGLATEHYRTPDSLEKVEAWYRGHLGSEFHQEGPNPLGVQKPEPGLATGDHDLAFVDDHGAGARIVALKKTADGTEIDLVRVGKREVQ